MLLWTLLRTLLFFAVDTKVISLTHYRLFQFNPPHDKNKIEHREEYSSSERKWPVSPACRRQRPLAPRRHNIGSGMRPKRRRQHGRCGEHAGKSRISCGKEGQGNGPNGTPRVCDGDDGQ
mmetsp:Transcript_45403/g.95292  ORF Transcript_45403/g.95292 Transcript_45403/m.95292 type:complete len:120 (-) Transcript_45403:712-1071(-)